MQFFYDENEWDDRRDEKKDVSTCTMMYFRSPPFSSVLFSSTFRLRSVYIRIKERENKEAEAMAGFQMVQIRRLLLLPAEAKGNKLNTFLEDSDRRHNSVRFFHNVQISLPIVDIILLFVLAFPHTYFSLHFFFHLSLSLWHRITRSTSIESDECNPKQNAIVSSSHRSSPEWMPDGPETRGLCTLSLVPVLTQHFHYIPFPLLSFSHCKTRMHLIALLSSSILLMRSTRHRVVCQMW